MQTFAILSAIGPDRPGIVADLTDFLLKRGANIEDSRMMVLGGDFSLILLLSAESEKMNSILSEKTGISELTGLTVIFRKTKSCRKKNSPSLVWKITAVTLDHPGIIHSISEIVANKGINILELQSQTNPAPVSGSPVFRMEMRLNVPADQKNSKLRDEITSFGDRENIDIELHVES